MAISCSQCGKENRDIAKYCKYCGIEVANSNESHQISDLDELIGLSELKKTIESKITIARRMLQCGMQISKKSFHTILIGNTGTAKSRIAPILAQSYFKNGIIEKSDPLIINAVDYANFAKDIPGNLKSAKGGIVFIDDVIKLVPDDFIPGRINPIDKLYVEMEKTNGDPIIILASKSEGFTEYLEKNPEVKGKFNLIFNLPDLSIDEMVDITQRQLQKHGFSITDETKTEIKVLYNNIFKKSGSSFDNGHAVNRIVGKISESFFAREQSDYNNKVILPQDIISLSEYESDKIVPIDIMKLKEVLSRVFCQEDNIELLIDTLEIWYAQVEKNRPLSTFLVGTSGVGKTYTVELLAQSLEQQGYEYCYFAMTEFSQEHSVSNLIGSPKGYVGSEEMPKLFEALSRSKKLIICFDEIEKAHEKILKALMQLLDKGFLSWSKGVGDFRDCIICFTSNAQMYQIVKLKEKFINTRRSVEGPEFQDSIKDILVRANIAPEVCGRINRFLVYNTLTPEAAIRITQRELGNLAKRYMLELKSIDVELLAQMAEKTAGSIYGARPIQQAVSSLLGKKMVSFTKKYPQIKQVQICKKDDGYIFDIINESDHNLIDTQFTVQKALDAYGKRKSTIGVLNIQNIKNILSEVYCQEDNINYLIDLLEIWYAQVEKNKPLSTFLVGTSGVGKTYTIELLAQSLEQQGYEYCYFAMTEFSQEHSVANLIGSPRGYVGSEEMPKLFEALSRTKKLIICFDEIEKAHEKILKALMQLLDKGFLSWSKGEGDFRECIICFTSNAQMNQIVKLKRDFINTGKSVEGPKFQDSIRDILVKTNIAPEVCGRINRFLVYNPLSYEAVIMIADQELNKLGKRYGIDVMSADKEFLTEMAEKTAGSIYGARPIQEAVSSKIGKKMVSFKRANPQCNQISICKIDGEFEVVKYNI
jgi:ATP-dependent Clp protease ATP-binding subunit ClpA